MWQQMFVVCLVQTLQLLMLIPPVGRISMRLTNLFANPAVNRIQDLKWSWPRVFERRRVALLAVRKYLFIISCTDTLVWIRSERSEREAGRFYFKLSANRCGPVATVYEAVPRADSIWDVGTLNYEGYELIELLLQVFPSACGALHQSNVNDRHDSLWGYLQDNPSPGKLFYLSWHTLTRCNAQYCPGPSICITVCNNNTSKEPERGNQLIDTADITFAKDGCWNYEHLSFKGMQTCCARLYF